MYWWQRFDRSEVERDFAVISAAGFDSVRIFLLWEDFQPGPETVSEGALDSLAIVAGVAAGRGLSLIPTLFTGHMSGVNWIPEWALDVPSGAPATSRFRIVSGGRVVNAKLRDWYSCDGILEAQCLLARRIAIRLRDAPAIWAYDLGNENSNCVVPPTREAAVRWLRAVTREIRTADPSRLITVGLHMEDLEEDRRLGPAEVALVSDFLCMHGYPVYSSWAEGPTDAMLLPFLGIITRWLAASGRPESSGGLEVLFQEFGASTTPPSQRELATATATARADTTLFLEEREAADFTGRALESLQRFGFLGAMIWCYGDYAKTMWSLPPLDESFHERSFGLWHADQSAKPALAEITRIAGAGRLPWLDNGAWIDIAASDFYLNPAGNLRHLYRRFCGVRNGEPQRTA